MLVAASVSLLTIWSVLPVSTFLGGHVQSESLVQYRWREDKNKIWSVSSWEGNVKSLGSWLYAWPNFLLALVWLFLSSSQPLCQETVMLHHCIHMFLMVLEKAISVFWETFSSSHDSMNFSFELKSIMNILYFIQIFQRLRIVQITAVPFLYWKTDGNHQVNSYFYN